MKVILSDEEAERIALQWIEGQGQNGPKGYIQLINAVFRGRHMAHWSCMDALNYAVAVCAKSYCTDKKSIKRKKIDQKDDQMTDTKELLPPIDFGCIHTHETYIDFKNQKRWQEPLNGKSCSMCKLAREKGQMK